MRKVLRLVFLFNRMLLYDVGFATSKRLNQKVYKIMEAWDPIIFIFPSEVINIISVYYSQPAPH